VANSAFRRPFRLRGMSVVFVAEVNDAKAVAVGIREEHRVWVVGVSIPSPLAERRSPRGALLRRLLRRIGHVKVQVQAGMVL
jgi:DNA-binding IclR family transcriptional regulator